jgi:phosphoglycolate phosphatase
MPKILINGKTLSSKLLLFDVDGTLVDDTPRYLSLGKARYDAFMKFASRKAAEEWARLSGVNPRIWTIDLEGPISKAPRRDDLAIAAGALYLDGNSWYKARKLAETIYEKADEIQNKTYKPKLFEGVKEKLKELYDSGIILGIGTNGVTKITEEMLTRLEVKHLFSVIVGADLVEKGKPAPDIILLACQKTGFNVSDIIYVGDQPTDIEAAEKAGVLTSIIIENKNAQKWKVPSIKSVKDIKIISES